MATMLNPVITQQVTRQIPNYLRNIPFFGNIGRSPSESMGFQNPYTEVQNNAQIRQQQQQQEQQQGILHNGAINIMNRLNQNMAPGPRINISLFDDNTEQIKNISNTRDELLKQDQQNQLSKIKYSQSQHGNPQQLQNNIDQIVNNTVSKAQQIKDIQKKLDRNSKEESKTNENYKDPVDQQVILERAQLQKQLKDLQGKQSNQQASDDFQNKMQLMNDLRQQKENAGSQNEKDLIQQKLDSLRNKGKNIREFTQEQLEEIQNLKQHAINQKIDQTTIDNAIQDIFKFGLLPPEAYSPNDFRNYLRKNNNNSPNNNNNNEPNNDPNPNNNDDYNNNDDNDNSNDDVKQAILNRLADIINNTNKDQQEKSNDIHQHINSLNDNEINIIFNMYTNEVSQDAHNQVHGHIDQDAILSSLIE